MSNRNKIQETVTFIHEALDKKSIDVYAKSKLAECILASLQDSIPNIHFYNFYDNLQNIKNECKTKLQHYIFFEIISTLTNHSFKDLFEKYDWLDDGYSPSKHNTFDFGEKIYDIFKKCKSDEDLKIFNSTLKSFTTYDIKEIITQYNYSCDMFQLTRVDMDLPRMY